MQWVPRRKQGLGRGLGCRMAGRADGVRSGGKMARLALAAAVGAVLGGAARGDNVTWISTDSGFWTDPFRWSTSPNLPGAGDDVTIDVPGADIVVTVKQDVQFIHSVISNEGLTIESGGLSLAADSTVNGAFTLSGVGQLGGAGNLTLNGPSIWTDSTVMDGTGKTVVSATGTLSIIPGTDNKNLARPLDNFGAVTFTGDNIFSAIGLHDATITNEVGATFTVNNIADAFFYGVSGSNAFLNNGTFNKSGTATATFGGTGSLPVSFVNTGQVNVQAGTLILQTGATHSGHFSISAGATLQFEGGHVFTATSDISGAGNVIFNSAGTNVSDGTFNVSGAVTFAGAVNTFNGAFNAGSLLVPNGATFTFNGTTTLGTLTATNLLLDGTGDVSISGVSQWDGFGTMAGTGKTIVTAGSTFSFSPGGAPKNLQRTFINDGRVNWSGTGALATLNLTNALFDNQASGTFNIAGDQYAFYGVSGSNTFNNAGIFNKIGPGSASFTGSGTSIVSLINSGTVNVSAGLLQLDSAFVNSGVVAMSGGTMTLNAGLNNTGVLNLTGGVLNLGGTISTAQLGTWSNSGGQVNLLGILNNTSSTLALNDTTGQLRMLDGSQLVGGALSTAGSSRLRIAGAATVDGLTLSGPVVISQLTNLTVLNGMTVGSSLTLDAAGNSTVTFSGSQTIGGSGIVTTSGGSGVATLATSTGATLTVGSGITVHAGTRDISLGSADGAVVNQGTFIDDAAGSTLTVSGTSVQNLGTFQIQNSGTIFVNGGLVNLSGGTLSGGSWQISSGGTLRLASGNINTNAAVLVLDGPGANIFTGASGTNDALANLTQNAIGGNLSILNGKTLTITGDFLNNGMLMIGAGSGLTVPGTFTHNGTMTTSGTITTGRTIIDGSFTLAGGTHTVSADFVLGSAKSTARYDLNDGTLSVGGFATLGMGPGGAGVFNQTGGAFTVGRQFFIASAGSNTSTYNLSSGSLNAGELLVGFFGGAQGVFNQSGGNVTLAANSAVSATGMLTLGYSSLSTTSGVYNQSDGTLTDQGAQIGFAGVGTFNQSGGTHTVNGTLAIGMFTGGTASYSMSNGASLNVTLDETIGTYAAGTFNQSGGVNTVGGQVRIGPNSGSSGIYNLAGGTLNAAGVDLVRGTFNAAGGTLNVPSFLQEGGDVTGLLAGQGIYTYSGGSFSGRLVNTGTVILNADFTAGNGLENRSLFDIASNRKVTLNGAGFSGNGTTTLSGTLTASLEHIGESLTASFTQSAGANNVSGDFTVGFGPGVTGSYTQQGGNLAVTGTSYIALDGTGNFAQSGGTHSAAALVIGAHAGSIGHYSLGDPATLNVAGNETIGLDGAGTFDQTGGTHSIAGTLALGGNSGGTGTFNLSGGTLTAGAINLVNGALNVSGGTLSYATLTQSGGDVSGVLTNATSYTFNGGTFTGRLINTGTAIVNADVTFGAGMENHGDFSVAGNHVVSLNGLELVNDGTFALAGSLSSASIKMGIAGDGAVTQTSGTNAVAGDLTLGFGSGHLGTYTLQGGALAVGGTTVVGLDGSGVFNQNRGTHTAVSLVIARNPGSTGSYTLGDSASLNVSGNETIGLAGAGTFNQTGGTHLASGTVTLGLNPGASGIYNLSGGTFTAGAINLNNGALNLSGGTLIYSSLVQNGGDISGKLFNAGAYTFNGGTFSGRLVNMGTVVASADLTIGNGLDNQASFSVDANRTVTLNGPGLTDDGSFALAGTLSSANVKIGSRADGTLIQSAGSHVIAGDLNIGFASAHAGIYSLQGGNLNVGGNETIGLDGSGTFNQSGGTHTVTGTMTLGMNAGASGNYNLSGGTLTAGAIKLVSGAFNAAGGQVSYTSFAQTGGDVSGVLTNATSYTMNGGTFSGRLINTGTAVVSADVAFGGGVDNQGNFSVAGNHVVSLNGSDLTNSGAYTQSGGSASLGKVSGSGTMAISGGTVLAKSIHQTSLSISNNAVVTLAVNGGASVVKSLSISSGGSATAALDLGNNTLLVDYSGASVIGDIRAAVAAGYGTSAAHWTGAGIRSRGAAADPSLGIGVAEAANILHISGTQTASFAGETVDATTVLVRVTKLGDTNLDGMVTFGDFQRFEAGFGQSGATWRTGDFNYDGVVDRADFALLYANFGTALNGAPVPASAAEIEAMSVFAGSVPEPSVIMGGVMVGMGAMLRRRRR